MTALQKLELRRSEIRVKLSDIATAEGELSDEQRSELDALKTEMNDLESRSQALILAGETQPDPVENDDSEGRELRSLIDASSVGMICDAALSGSPVDGETRELQEHLGLDRNFVPLDLLRETRAVTPGIDAGTSVAETLMPVFAQGATAFLHIPMPRVPVGARNFPVLTSRANVSGPHVDSTSVSETTGSFTANELKPGRIQASFFYRRTDSARFAELDSALREALSGSLMEALDNKVLTGANGLFTGTNLANNAASGIDTFQTLISRLGFGNVDGRYANMLTDLKLLVGSATFAFAGTLYNNPVYDSANAVLSGKLGGFRVTAHAPAVASNKQNAIIRRGMRRDAVCPLWEGVKLIPDEITRVKTGEIQLTAVMLFAFKILRADGFVKVETQHGA